MLRQLKISNFAIIDELVVEFESGLSVISGETGAGKSILVDAIEQLLCQRASVQYIGPYQKRALIEAVFDIKQCEKIPLFMDNGIDCDDYLMVSKEIEASGRAIIRINGQIKPFAFLKALLEYVVCLHTQFQTSSLLSHEATLEYIDKLANIRQTSDYLLFCDHYQEYTKKQNEYQDLLATKDQSDYLEHIEIQLTELSDYLYSAEQIEEMMEQKKLLSTFEKDAKALKQVITILGENKVLSGLHEAMRLLSKVDDTLTTDVSDVYFQLEEVVGQIQTKYKQTNFSSCDFEIITEKLYETKRLQKRYGFDLIKIHSELLAKFAIAKDIDHHLDRLVSEMATLKSAMDILCININQIRNRMITQLEVDVNSLFSKVHLVDAKLKVDIHVHDLFFKTGNVTVKLMVCMNKGHSFLPLVDVVSGGEFSRIQLVLKVIMAEQEDVSLYVFDEIDSGVSGRVALAMARMMKELSQRKQVIVITHLPQVASQADFHYQVIKHDSNDTIYSELVLLDNQAHIEQIASMLSGDKVTQVAILQAKELIYG